MLLVSVNPLPEEPLSLLLRLPEELAFWKRCLLEPELPPEPAFLHAGPLLTPGFSPVCCFLLDDELEDAEEPVGPPLDSLLLLLLPVLLMVNLRPSWLVFTMYSVDGLGDGPDDPATLLGPQIPLELELELETEL